MKYKIIKTFLAFGAILFVLGAEANATHIILGLVDDRSNAAKKELPLKFAELITKTGYIKDGNFIVKNYPKIIEDTRIDFGEIDLKDVNTLHVAVAENKDYNQSNKVDFFSGRLWADGASNYPSEVNSWKQLILTLNIKDGDETWIRLIYSGN